MFQVGSACAITQIRRNRNVLELPVAFVVARNDAFIVASVDNVWIRRRGRNIARFSAPNRIPVGTIDCAVVAATRNRDGAVVLLRPVDIIRSTSVGNDVIELRGWLIVFTRPRLSTIEAHGGSAIIGGNHAPRISGINPQAVIVAMRHFDFVEVASAICGLVEIHIHHIDGVRFLRIGNDVHVIPGALLDGPALIHRLPGLAAIIGAIQSALMSFNQGIHAIGVGCDRDTDTTVGLFGEPMLFQPFPGSASVVRAIETASGPSAGETPGHAPGLP